MLNIITIQGRFTRDPELRYTQSNKSVASFTLAVDRDFGDKATDFIDCVAWSNTADFIAKHFAKGQLATVAGRLQFRDWQDKEGNNRRNAEVLVSNIYFCEKKNSPVMVEVDEDDGDLPWN